MASVAGSSTLKYVLAIDLGSGGPKVVLLSERGELVASSSRRIETLLTADGGGEQDPDQWWQSITDAVRQVVTPRPVPIEDIIAVACTTQWSVTVPVDEQGRHLMNAVHWTDSRGARYTARATDGLIKINGYGVRRLIRWLRMTGGVPTHSGADALAHILFIKHERPDVYRRTYKFLEPMDYINLRLTGRVAASYATVFPMLLTDNRDPRRVTYDERLIAWTGLDRAKLPDLFPVDEVLGPLRAELADAWGLSRATQVVIGMCDSQAAVLGSGAVQDYQGHVCLGTTAWMSCHVPFKRTHLGSYLATMPAAVPGRNMVMAEQGAAGKCLESFVDGWLAAADALSDGPRPADLYERLERMVAEVPAGSENLLFLPWLNGCRPAQRGRRYSGRILEPVAATRPGPCEPCDYGRRCLQSALAAWSGRAFHRAPLWGAEFHRRRRDRPPGARSWPMC